MFFAKSHEKHLVIEWLPWRQNKRYLIICIFFETVRDEPIPHKNFMFLGQGSHEIPGGGRPDPPWYPMWVPIPLVTEGLTFLSLEPKR